jgi:hypothetical protein
VVTIAHDDPRTGFREELAKSASRVAHDTKRELAKTDDGRDHAAAKLWGVTHGEIADIRNALDHLR